MQLVDSVVRKTNDQLSDSAALLQDILSAAADEATGEWALPLAPERVAAMERVGSAGTCFLPPCLDLLLHCVFRSRALRRRPASLGLARLPAAALRLPRAATHLTPSLPTPSHRIVPHCAARHHTTLHLITPSVYSCRSWMPTQAGWTRRFFLTALRGCGGRRMTSSMASAASFAVTSAFYGFAVRCRCFLCTFGVSCVCCAAGWWPCLRIRRTAL